MFRRRSRLEEQVGGAGRAVLLRRDAETLRYALTEAAGRDGEARAALEHVDGWARYSGDSPVVVVPLPSRTLAASRAALREFIGARPVEDAGPARRLYDQMMRPTSRRVRRRRAAG